MLGPGNASGPSLAPRHDAGVLLFVACVENEGAARGGGDHILGLLAPPRPGLRGEEGGLRLQELRGRRAALAGPLVPAAVEDRDAVVAVVGQGPPQARGELP